MSVSYRSAPARDYHARARESIPISESPPFVPLWAHLPQPYLDVPALSPTVLSCDHMDTHCKVKLHNREDQLTSSKPSVQDRRVIHWAVCDCGWVSPEHYDWMSAEDDGEEHLRQRHEEEKKCWPSQ